MKKKVKRLFTKKLHPNGRGPVFKTIFRSLTSGTKVKSKIDNG
jgi:hypothetical protein